MVRYAGKKNIYIYIFSNITKETASGFGERATKLTRGVGVGGYNKIEINSL